MVNSRYVEIIDANKNKSFLDTIHAFQDEEGYLTKEAIKALAKEYGSSPAKIYESASFYSMIRFAPKPMVTIQICRSAPCHVAGAGEVIRALEDELGILMGEETADGKYRLEYVECLGQCQESPALVINGELHTGMTPEKVIELIGKGS